MKQDKHSKNVVYFLCTPSLGILDNWLPVIWELKGKRKDLKFVFILSKARSVDEIDLSNVLFVLASKVFDQIVFMSHGEVWLKADSFAQAKALNKVEGAEWYLSRAISKFKQYSITKPAGSLLGFCYKQLCTLRKRKHCPDWQRIHNDGACILYDVYEESKPYNAWLMNHFRDLPKFSLCHGIDIQNGGVLKGNNQNFQKKYRKDIQAFLFSEKEIPIYAERYNIPESNMKVVGVPRHEPAWIDFTISNISEGYSELQDDFVFIISRPGTTKYHPQERKKQALEDIKKLAWGDLNKKIVVKLHPKEKKKGLYEEVFGLDTYGDKWIYSNLHPYLLGRKCLFAVSFFSGVSIDMIALGVPAIERLDLRGIPEYDNSESLRDHDGEPVLSIRFLNLVLGASDYQQMKFHAMEIMNNREPVLERLQARYIELFPRIENVNEIIADDIMAVFNKNRG